MLGFLLTALVTLSVVGTPVPVFAQPAGYYVSPSITTGGEYDDNIFSTPSSVDFDEPEPAGSAGDTDGTNGTMDRDPADPSVRREEKVEDVSSVTTPAISLSYRSEPFSLVSRYSITGEAYADRSELNSFPSRQRASVTGTYRTSGGRLTVSAGGGFTETLRARDLNLIGLTGDPGVPPAAELPEAERDPLQDVAAEPSALPESNLERRRGRAVVYNARSSVSYDVTERTTAVGHAGFALTDQVGGTEGTNVFVGPRLNHRLSPLDSVRLTYRFQTFLFDDLGPDDPDVDRNRDSHVATAGYSRKLTENLSLGMDAGARVLGGETRPEVSGHLGYRPRLTRRAIASLRYSRSFTTTVGEPGVVEAQTVAGQLFYRVTKFLGTDLGAAWTRADQDFSDADVYRATFGASYPFQRWLSAFVFYRFSFVDQEFSGFATARTEEIFRNTVFLGISAGSLYRLY